VRKINIDDFDIRSLREQAGLTQAELGLRIGRSQSQVARIEADPLSVDLSMLRMILDACGAVRALGGIHAGQPFERLIKLSTVVREIAFRWDLEAQSEPLLSPAVHAVDKLNYQIEVLARLPVCCLVGPVDAGKSTIANSLLGSRYLATQWSVTTRVLTFVSHVDRRPKGLDSLVYLLDSYFDPADRFDPQKIIDCSLQFGGLELLDQKSDSTSSDSSSKENFSWGLDAETELQLGRVNPISARCALVYLESPILHACELVDTPGLGYTERDNELAAAGIKFADLCLICSAPQNFMSSQTLSLLEIVREHVQQVSFDQEKLLRGLLLLVTHVGDNITDASLLAIREGALRTWATFAESLGLEVEENTVQLRQRFYPFSPSNEDRTRAFFNEIKAVLEVVIPNGRRKKVSDAIENATNEVTKMIKNNVDQSNGNEQIRLHLAQVKAHAKKYEAERRRLKTILGVVIEDARLTVLTDWESIFANLSSPTKLSQLLATKITKMESETLAENLIAPLVLDEARRQLEGTFARQRLAIQDQERALSATFPEIGSSAGFATNKGFQIHLDQPHLDDQKDGFGGILATSAIAGALVFLPAAFVLSFGGLAMSKASRSFFKNRKSGHERAAVDLSVAIQNSNLQIRVTRAIESEFIDLRRRLAMRFADLDKMSLEGGTLATSEAALIRSLEARLASISNTQLINSKLNVLQKEVEGTLHSLNS
jgi:transcriptional regulator with XRE-family HTH domain